MRLGHSQAGMRLTDPDPAGLCRLVHLPVSVTPASHPVGARGGGTGVFGRKPIGHMTCTPPKYLPRAQHVPGTVLGTEAMAENRHRQIPAGLSTRVGVGCKGILLDTKGELDTGRSSVIV